MAGLVAYESSDEEEEIERIEQSVPEKKAPATATVAIQSRNPEQEHETTSQKLEPTSQSHDPVTIGPVQQNAVALGPSLPPMEEALVKEQDAQTPSSPYSASRALLRDLTLPSEPNLDIPPSPPGSPPPGANKKFEQFLELKKTGTHFNAKLEQSSALRNPSLMDKLMKFVDLDERTQYSTTLPSELWNPASFPDWAFKNRLRKSSEKLAKERETDKAAGGRTAIDFVPSTNPASAGATATSGISRGEKRKGGWK
ncbi:hypothetical protein ACJ41O_002648 [Fusarium nematophilum]